MTPRRKLTPAQRAVLWNRQNGKCACGCDEPLTGKTSIDEDEHEIARWISGDDSLANRRLMLKGHHAKKTAEDQRIIAKIKRQIAKAAGTWRSNRKKIRGRTKIESRGFDKTLRKKLDGTVERRP